MTTTTVVFDCFRTTGCKQRVTYCSHAPVLTKSRFFHPIGRYSIIVPE